MAYENARKREEFMKQEIRNYYENEALKEQEESRKGLFYILYILVIIVFLEKKLIILK